MAIDVDDLSALLDEVGRFCAGRIEAACASPLVPLSHSALDELTREAGDLGLLPEAGPSPGCALWEQSDTAADMAFSLRALSRVAQANAGVALAWHRIALAARLSRQLEQPQTVQPSKTALVIGGHYGLGREAMARWLRAEASAQDESFLSEWLDRRCAAPLCAPAHWRALLWPVWQGGGIAWVRVLREQLSVRPCARQHGLDELDMFMVSTGDMPAAAATSGVDARRVYADLLTLDLLGLMAIAGGALERAARLALDYARMRRQGGSLIIHHPAVSHMLAEIEAVRSQARAMLSAFCVPLPSIDLGDVLAWRVRLHDALCQAANLAVQVHGGVGYMRDVGVEKVLRDQNMLRAIGGGRREAWSFLAAWTGAYA